MRFRSSEHIEASAKSGKAEALPPQWVVTIRLFDIPCS
jgi:hypothetical protein